MDYDLFDGGSKQRLIKFQCAEDPAFWPKAPSEFMFIYEAINTVGASLFGPDWSGKELEAVIWDQSPAYLRRPALMNSGGGAPGGGRAAARPEISPVLADALKQQNAHVVEWMFSLSQSRWEENQRCIQRLKGTVDWMAQKCRDAELHSHARRKIGGGLYEMFAWEWNVENEMQLFVSQGGFNRYFYEVSPARTFEVYIFFRRSEIAAVLEGQSAAPLLVRETDISSLSPYTQLAVRLALAKGYLSKASCETQAIREAEVRAAWPTAMPDVPITENAVSMVARMMGFPDAEAIQRGQQGGRAKTG